jgi:hypothetical protein
VALRAEGSSFSGVGNTGLRVFALDGTGRKTDVCVIRDMDTG